MIVQVLFTVPRRLPVRRAGDNSNPKLFGKKDASGEFVQAAAWRSAVHSPLARLLDHRYPGGACQRIRECGRGALWRDRRASRHEHRSRPQGGLRFPHAAAGTSPRLRQRYRGRFRGHRKRDHRAPLRRRCARSRAHRSARASPRGNARPRHAVGENVRRKRTRMDAAHAGGNGAPFPPTTKSFP